MKTKTLTPKQYEKQHPEKYVMVTYEFGFPVYIAPSEKLFEPTQITDKKEEAQVWTAMDLGPTKLEYHKHITGYTGLVFEQIAA